MRPKAIGIRDGCFVAHACLAETVDHIEHGRLMMHRLSERVPLACGCWASRSEIKPGDLAAHERLLGCWIARLRDAKRLPQRIAVAAVTHRVTHDLRILTSNMLQGRLLNSTTGRLALWVPPSRFASERPELAYASLASCPVSCCQRSSTCRDQESRQYRRHQTLRLR